MRPLLATEELTVLRPPPEDPSVPILDGVTFSLFHGERLAIAGANGAGKSTLLHSLLGLRPRHQGRIEIFGLPRLSEADFQEIRPQVGLLFQDADDQLFCPTVGEDLAFGPLNLGLSRQEAQQRGEDALRLVGLPLSFAQRSPHRLSGGEKKLVALATVLALHPQILLLDEPTNALDTAARLRLQEVLTSLPQAMILVSHDHDFARHIATRHARLEQGRWRD